MVDELSSRILECLEDKPRSISEIARELDEEKYAVSKKIEALDDDGYINTYTIGRSTACILQSDDDDADDAAAAGQASVGAREREFDFSEQSGQETLDKPEIPSRPTGAEGVQRDGDGPRTIGIVSGKGGVGKTVVTLNLGAAMMALGEDVIVLDADAEMPNIGLQLGMHTYPTSLTEVVEQEVHIMSAMHVDSDSGLRIIPVSLSQEPPEAAVDEAIGMIPGHYTVLVDSPPGYERPLQRVIDTCDELVFVTTPEIPSIADTYKLYQEAMRQGATALGVVINMYSSTKNHLSVTEVQKALEMPVLGVIDQTGLVQRSIMKNNPLVSFKPYAKPSREFKKIAADLTGHDYEETVVDRIRGLLP